MGQELNRVVFDTSVLLSVAGRPGTVYSTWKAVIDGKIHAFTSETALAELKDVLSRPKIREHYGVSLDPLNVIRFIAAYRSIATVSVVVPARFKLNADPKDSQFLNLAIEVQANILVTFDEAHILPLRDSSHPQYEELKLLAPNLKLLKPSELARELICTVCCSCLGTVSPMQVSTYLTSIIPKARTLTLLNSKSIAINWWTFHRYQILKMILENFFVTIFCDHI